MRRIYISEEINWGIELEVMEMEQGIEGSFFINWAAVTSTNWIGNLENGFLFLLLEKSFKIKFFYVQFVNLDIWKLKFSTKSFSKYLSFLNISIFPRSSFKSV